eukprot:s46_g53.t1
MFHIPPTKSVAVTASVMAPHKQRMAVAALQRITGNSYLQRSGKTCQAPTDCAANVPAAIGWSRGFSVFQRTSLGFRRSRRRATPVMTRESPRATMPSMRLEQAAGGHSWEESPASSDVNETDAVEASPASLREEVRSKKTSSLLSDVVNGPGMPWLCPISG